MSSEDCGQSRSSGVEKYREAGVDIDAGNRAVELLSGTLASARTPEVMSLPGSFAGMYSANALDPMSVLVASTDGVGTKAVLAARYERWYQIGVDLVNHCIGDVVVHGARPLFFLDYIATSELVPEVVAEIVAGIADACREAGCALLGGETAEMPSVYTPGSVDVVGTIIAATRTDQLWPRFETIKPGDVLVGVASSGPHTNGYSLIRKILDDQVSLLDETAHKSLVDAVLEPHRSYLPFVLELPELGVQPKAMAHITGGGFFDNLPRVLPDHLGAQIDLGSWMVPKLFATLVDMGELDDTEAFRVWNMGIGFVVVVDDTSAAVLVDQGHSLIGNVIDISRTDQADTVGGSSGDMGEGGRDTGGGDRGKRGNDTCGGDSGRLVLSGVWRWGVWD